MSQVHLKIFWKGHPGLPLKVGSLSDLGKNAVWCTKLWYSTFVAFLIFFFPLSSEKKATGCKKFWHRVFLGGGGLLQSASAFFLEKGRAAFSIHFKLSFFFFPVEKICQHLFG